jgi:DNA-binding transcriptional regulator YhcF (GntR family)
MTDVRIVVDADSGVPPWRQIYYQIERMIVGGVLAPGTRLPSIRQLARDFGLAAGTVARVYQELEAMTLVATSRSQGTVVAEPASRPDRDLLLRTEAARFAAFAKDLGAGMDAALGAVRDAYSG